MQIVPLGMDAARVKPALSGRPSTLRDRLGSALKTLILPENWRSYVGAQLVLPGTGKDLSQELSQAHLNGVVAICLRWVMDNLPEPDLQVVEKNAEGEWQALDEHPLVTLLEQPNPFYDGDTLMAATALSYLVNGNAYWYKARAMEGTGPVRELWWMPHWAMRPWRPTESREPFTHWEYTAGGKRVLYRREDVVHHRFGADPDDSRLGFARLKAVAREIAADNEAATYEMAILENMGIAGIIISPQAGGKFTDPQKQSLIEMFKSKIRGDRRGEPLGSTIPIDAKNIAFSPEQLALDRMRQQPTSRICAAIGVHPAAVNLSVGNGPSAFDNGGQHEQARKASYHDCLIPMQGRFARTMTRDLLRELDPNKKRRVRYCYDEISVLQEDRNERHKRAREDYRAGGITLNEYRNEMGMKPVKGTDGDRFYSPPVRPVAPGTEPTDPKKPPQGQGQDEDQEKRRPLLVKLRELRSATLVSNGNGKH